MALGVAFPRVHEARTAASAESGLGGQAAALPDRLAVPIFVANVVPTAVLLIVLPSLIVPFAVSALVIMVSRGSYTGVIFILAQQLQLASGYSPLRAGPAFVPLALANSLGATIGYRVRFDALAGLPPGVDREAATSFVRGRAASSREPRLAQQFQDAATPEFGEGFGLTTVVVAAALVAVAVVCWSYFDDGAGADQ